MYLDQYERVIRWYSKFKEINDRIVHKCDSEYYKDIVYSFFQNCYHLKDWIKNDDSADAIIRKNVECFMGKSTVLKICGDICNGSKHSVLTQAKIDKDTKIERTNHNLVLGYVEPIYSAKFVITSNNIDYDAFDLATQCINEWKGFLGL